MKDIKSIYNVFIESGSSAISTNLLNQIRELKHYEFERGNPDIFKDESGTLSIDIDGNLTFENSFKIHPRKWATHLNVPEPYDIVVLLDGVLYESPDTYSERDFVVASVKCLETELTIDYIRDEWNESGYNYLAFNQAVQDWE
ncbi:hypothetical protein HPMBJEAJ_00075 [Aeromonas phage avDM6]|nr:hypothetical protein HPMBJEAJ_00075 [Aeromonas phage avDM6]